MSNTLDYDLITSNADQNVPPLYFLTGSSRGGRNDIVFWNDLPLPQKSIGEIVEVSLVPVNALSMYQSSEGNLAAHRNGEAEILNVPILIHIKARRGQSGIENFWDKHLVLQIFGHKWPNPGDRPRIQVVDLVIGQHTTTYFILRC